MQRSELYVGIIDLIIHTDVVGYLFKERETFFDGPSHRNKESYRARGVARATKVTRFFHRRRTAKPLANFFRTTVHHPRRTRVGRDADRVDTMWVEGCGRTRRDATLRNALFFARRFLSSLSFQLRGGKGIEDWKGGRVVASSRTTSGSHLRGY